MKKLLPLFIAVILIVILAVPSFAATVEQYSYNGVVLPKLPDNDKSKAIIGEVNGQYYLKLTNNTFYLESDGTIFFDKNADYIAVNDSWVLIDASVRAKVFWSNTRISSSDNKVVVNASDPMVILVEVPDPPPSIEDILSDAGQIFSSAVSWVSDVGAAILAQPLLLAFTALPLCGLGIAVFRRLKETV